MIILPYDIIGLITGYLNLQELDNLSITCRYFHSYLHDRIDRRSGRLWIDIGGKLISVGLDFRVAKILAIDPGSQF